jgi:AcrR family transcriptional regulator
MVRKNTPDAKHRILQAAIQVFAEKSFAGSRVDEIAEMANVPKSVIYYHFKSKDEILEVLIQDFVRSYLELITVAEQDTHQSKAQVLEDRVQNRYSQFEEENADLIRIILIESLKKTNDTPVVFQIVEAMIAKESTFSGVAHWKEYNKQERLVAEFFTNIIPNYAFICFRQAWAEYFDIKAAEVSKIFTKVFMATHGAYHKYHE